LQSPPFGAVDTRSDAHVQRQCLTASLFRIAMVVFGAVLARSLRLLV
jgi:hypothetical protein